MKLALNVVLLLVMAAACQTAAEAADPVWGKQVCDACRMLVSDPRYAAQLLDAEGERSFYDDIGCLTEALDALPAPPRGIWVRDATGRWIDARGAHYGSSAPSPMDYGFVPEEHGALDFDAVRRTAVTKRAKAAP